MAGPRKYSLNEDYFDVIDSSDKAYFLGFLYGDGYNNEKMSTISINLQEKDRDILEKLKLLINSNKPLQLINYKKYAYKNNFDRQNQYRLCICSKKISQRLSELGCWQNKSLNIEFLTEKQISKKLMKYFIRGLWDSDGNFCKYNIKQNNTSKMTAGILSTVSFCEKLKNLLIEELHINSCIMKNKNKYPENIRWLQISGTNQVTKFLDWIYEDATIYLNRKYKKYQDIKISKDIYDRSTTNNQGIQR